METLFTADLHLGHEGILKYRDFSSLDEMDVELIENYNEVVSRKDTVYILGDFAWKNHGSYLARLNGKKILVRGNHDKFSEDVLRQFTGVYDLKHMKLDKRRLVLSHSPMLTWEGSQSGSWNFHGHSHGRVEEVDSVLRCDVGVDVWDYSPAHFETLKMKMDSRRDAFLNREKKSDDELNAIVQKNLSDNRFYTWV